MFDVRSLVILVVLALLIGAVVGWRRRSVTVPMAGAEEPARVYPTSVSSLEILPIPQKPRGNRLLVLPLVKAGSSIILDMEENREKPERGLVLRRGPGGIGVKTGNPVPVESAEGELVWYGKYAGMKHEIQGPADQHGRTKPLVVYILSDSEVLLAQSADTLDLVMHDNDPRKIHEVGLTCEDCPRADLSALREAAYGEAAAPVVVNDAAIAAERDRAGISLVTER